MNQVMQTLTASGNFHRQVSLLVRERLIGADEALGFSKQVFHEVWAARTMRGAVIVGSEARKRVNFKRDNGATVEIWVLFEVSTANIHIKRISHSQAATQATLAQAVKLGESDENS